MKNLHALYQFSYIQLHNCGHANLGDEDYPIAKTAPKDPNKPLERRKVEIQILHMSDQSQQMVSLLFETSIILVKFGI